MNETRNPLGYLHDWKPYRKSQVMLGQVKCILDEYAAYLPLTCRQIYYRMIGGFGHPKGSSSSAASTTCLSTLDARGRSRLSTSATTGS